MVTARIRTNARRVTVKVRNGPARTITAPAAVTPKRAPARRLLRPVRPAETMGPSGEMLEK